MSYTITHLRPHYSPHGQAVAPDGRAYDLEDAGPAVTAPTLDDAQRVVASMLGRAVWTAVEGMSADTWWGAYTPAERSEADQAISEAGGEVELADGSRVEVRPT